MDKDKLMKLYFYFFGLVNIFLLSFAVPIFFGFLLWEPRNIPNEMMMSGIYFSMGTMMVLTARNFKNQKGFVDFIILANAIHAIIMVVYAKNMIHIVVDAAGTGLMAIIPLTIYPWDIKNFLRYD